MAEAFFHGVLDVGLDVDVGDLTLHCSVSTEDLLQRKHGRKESRVRCAAQPCACACFGLISISTLFGSWMRGCEV